MAVHPEGMLLVYGIPHKECTHEALHAWYRVHSRTRLRWPGMISVDRLVSADGKDPYHLGIYHIDKVADLGKQEYRDMMKPVDQKWEDEMEAIIDYDRREYKEIKQFDEDLEDVPSFIEALGYSVGQSDEAAFWKWHDGDYMTKVKALPGWQMTRVYNCNAHLMIYGGKWVPPKDGTGAPTYLTMHWFAQKPEEKDISLAKAPVRLTQDEGAHLFEEVDPVRR